MIDAVMRGALDQAQTLQLCAESPELVTLGLLAAGTRITCSAGLGGAMVKDVVAREENADAGVLKT